MKQRKIRGSRNVVFKKDDEDLVDRKEIQWRSVANIGYLKRTIRKRQLKFLGHTNRRSGVERLALCGKINGKRDRGRRRLTYLESLNTWDTNTSMGNNEFLQMSNNRKECRFMIACLFQIWHLKKKKTLVQSVWYLDDIIIWFFLFFVKQYKLL